jgi:quercetin dioxygenase-like cupin family protein
MQKRSTETVDWDRRLVDRPGWEGLRVWWLATRAETGIGGAVMNITEFPPGMAHEVHRHDNAPELCYIESGSGLHTSDGPPVRLVPGEVAVVPASEWHGFYNDREETVRMIAFWPGIESYEELGYVVLPDWRAVLERTLGRPV